MARIKNVGNLDRIKREFPTHLSESYGIIKAACNKAGISRETYYNWRKADPEFAKACDETEVMTHSMVEDVLKTMILEKNPSAVFFYLKTKCKHLGYVERVESTGAGGGAIQNEVTINATKTDMEILEEYKNKLVGNE